MLCNSCISWANKKCEDCYKYPAMAALHLTPRQWSQIELIGVTESTNGEPEMERALCKGFVDSIVVEGTH